MPSFFFQIKYFENLEKYREHHNKHLCSDHPEITNVNLFAVIVSSLEFLFLN